jgi:thioesterase domain-containing protein
LFLLHSEGGDLLFWRDLVRYLGPEQPCFGIQPARRGGVLETFSGLADRAACYVAAMRRCQPEGPYALAGYSLGGVLALEMARQLVAQDQHVAFLGIVDSWGKDYPRRLPLIPRIGDHVKHLWALPRAEKLAYTRTRTRAAVGSLKRRIQQPPAPESPSSTASTFNWSRHDLLPYRGHVVLFRAAQQPRWVGNRFDDPAMGWRQIATEGVDVYTVPGAHLSLFGAENVEVLADAVNASLRATERAPVDPSSERVRGRETSAHQERQRRLVAGRGPW